MWTFFIHFHEELIRILFDLLAEGRVTVSHLLFSKKPNSSSSSLFLILSLTLPTLPVFFILSFLTHSISFPDPVSSIQSSLSLIVPWLFSLTLPIPLLFFFLSFLTHSILPFSYCPLAFFTHSSYPSSILLSLFPHSLHHSPYYPVSAIQSSLSLIVPWLFSLTLPIPLLFFFLSFLTHSITLPTTQYQPFNPPFLLLSLGFFHSLFLFLFYSSFSLSSLTPSLSLLPSISHSILPFSYCPLAFFTHSSYPSSILLSLFPHSLHHSVHYPVSAIQSSLSLIVPWLFSLTLPIPLLFFFLSFLTHSITLSTTQYQPFNPPFLLLFLDFFHSLFLSLFYSLSSLIFFPFFYPFLCVTSILSSPSSFSNGLFFFFLWGENMTV